MSVALFAARRAGQSWARVVPTWLESCRRGLHRSSGHVRVQDIRNIGIIAHVDAGKTTTTERMLYRGGVTKRVGAVDSGNTVTDFLELERERGITIQSAAITFNWPLPGTCPPGSSPKTINLIDTPGHQDFRFEVDRCLPVLDGAVCIIDAVKGVEAHTERVWASAQKHRIPRIMYVNKLDRDGASFKRSIDDIVARLNGIPLICQIPQWEEDRFVGVVDVVEGKPPSREAELAKSALIETLADHDEEFMDLFAENNLVSSAIIKAAIRRVISNGDGRIIPVFVGASFRDIGVEPLMDAIVDYLPSPEERPDLEVELSTGKQSLSKLIAETSDSRTGISRLGSVSSVFKVFNHPKEGILSYVRVYHGELKRNAVTLNTHTNASERPLALLQIAADRTHEVTHLSAGQIGAMKGLKKSRTGDTLLTTTSSKALPEPLQHIQVRPPDIPPAVAFLAIVPYGQIAVDELKVALESASREDPSLRWSWSDKDEQYTLQGMGKLHLDIAVYNLKQNLKKIDAIFSDIEVDYKECVTGLVGPHHIVYDKVVGGKPGVVSCTVTLENLEPYHCDEAVGARTEIGGNIIDVALSDEALATTGATLPEAERQNLVNGVVAALSRGPRRGRPIQRTYVRLTLDGMSTASGGHFSSAASKATREALNSGLETQKIGILEPVMDVRLLCPEEVASVVRHDITSGRGGRVYDTLSLSPSDDRIPIDRSKIYCPPDPYDSITSLRGVKGRPRTVEILAKVPFKETLDYDSRLRSKTGGRHSMTMVFASFERVTGARDKEL